jgi:DNA-binding MarR family transcriptional regulator
MAAKRRSSATPGVDPAACAEAARVCACLNLRKASRSVTRLYDEALQPSGLKSTQFVVLVAIAADGEPTLPRLARSLGLDRSSLTRNLRPLERLGLVEKRGLDSPGAATVRLSRRGAVVLQKTIPLWAAVQSEFESRIGGGRWQTLLGELEKVREATQAG